MKSQQKPLSILIAALLLGSTAASTAACSKAEENPPAVTHADTTDAEADTDPSFEGETQPAPEPAPVGKAEPPRLTFTPSVTVTETQDTATVTHEDGLSYLATGYTSVNNNLLTFTEGLTLTFDPTDTAVGFNRFIMGYVSTQPLYGKITYEVEGATVTDDFYPVAEKREGGRTRYGNLLLVGDDLFYRTRVEKNGLRGHA